MATVHQPASPHQRPDDVRLPRCWLAGVLDDGLESSFLFLLIPLTPINIMNAPQTRNYRKQFELIREGRDFSRLTYLPGDFSEEFVMAVTDEKWGQWYKR